MICNFCCCHVLNKNIWKSLLLQKCHFWTFNDSERFQIIFWSTYWVSIAKTFMLLYKKRLISWTYKNLLLTINLWNTWTLQLNYINQMKWYTKDNQRTSLIKCGSWQKCFTLCFIKLQKMSFILISFPISDMTQKQFWRIIPIWRILSPNYLFVNELNVLLNL